MKIRTHINAQEFLLANEGYLLKKEAVNSLLLGLTYTSSKIEKDNSLFLDLKDHEEILFSAIRTSGRNLIISGIEQKFEEVIPQLINYIKDHQLRFPGINGPADLVLPFATAIKEEMNWNYQIEFEQWVYKITASDLDTNNDINLMQADLSHKNLVAHWLHEFYKEVLYQITESEALEIAQIKIKAKEVYILKDGTFKSMSCIARPTREGITINYVYTPPENRGKGYAIKTVQALCQKMLNHDYKFCTLFSDIHNPVSNKMYKKIGFKPIKAFISVKFNEPEVLS